MTAWKGWPPGSATSNARYAALVTAELGAGPLAIARAQRAQTARVLTETTTLPLSEIAFAAGFASIRQFNSTIREVFAVTPTELRERAARRGSRAGTKPRPRARRAVGLAGPASDPAAPGLIRLRLPYRAPIDTGRLLRFLAARAIPGVESADDGCYRRTLLLPNGTGILSVSLPAGDGGAGYLDCELQLEDLRDLTAAVQRCRRLLDLDADPQAVTAFLAASGPVLGPLALANPGRRVPGHVDGNELALRAVLGQQVSVAAARRLGARLVAAYGKPLERPDGTLTHCFPTAETLAAADPATLPMPRARAAALTGLAAALAAGDLSLDPGRRTGPRRGAAAGPARHRAVDGGLHPDARAVRSRMRSCLLTSACSGARPAGAGRAERSGADRAARQAAALAEHWHPWRSYAVHHLWAYLEEK